MQNELQTAQIGCTEGRHGVVKAENFLVLPVFSRAHTKSSIAAVVLKKMKSVRVHLQPLHYRAMATLELFFVHSAPWRWWWSCHRTASAGPRLTQYRLCKIFERLRRPCSIELFHRSDQYRCYCESTRPRAAVSHNLLGAGL